MKNNTKKYVGEIEILTISNVALDEYRKNAKHCSDLKRDILELKMSAMVKNAKLLGTSSDKHVYLFGSFLMIVNHRTSKIEVVSWKIANHYGKLSMETIANLRNDYTALGLTLDGNAFATNSKLKAI